MTLHIAFYLIFNQWCIIFCFAQGQQLGIRELSQPTHIILKVDWIISMLHWQSYIIQKFKAPHDNGDTNIIWITLKKGFLCSPGLRAGIVLVVCHSGVKGPGGQGPWIHKWTLPLPSSPSSSLRTYSRRQVSVPKRSWSPTSSVLLRL